MVGHCTKGRGVAPLTQRDSGLLCARTQWEVEHQKIHFQNNLAVSRLGTLRARKGNPRFEGKEEGERK